MEWKAYPHGQSDRGGRRKFKIAKKSPSEATLAKIFGVNRNILREAFKALKERGLIEVKTGHGAYVVTSEYSILKDDVTRLLVLNNVDTSDVYFLRLG